MKLNITCIPGDGIGPEIVAKALAEAEVYTKCVPIVVGDRAAIEDAISFCKLPLRIHEIESPAEAEGKFGKLDLINLNMLKKGGWEYKKNTALGGKVSYEYITRAISLAKNGEVSAVVTAPISKESIQIAVFKSSDLYYLLCCC